MGLKNVLLAHNHWIINISLTAMGFGVKDDILQEGKLLQNTSINHPGYTHI